MSEAAAIMAGSPAAPLVVLASASRPRRMLLENAGLRPTVAPAAVDEDEIKRSLRADGAPVEAVAESLAELKAIKISPQHPGALVIGADQMLACGDDWYDKPTSHEIAAEQLQALSGRSHSLVTAVVVVRDSARVWHHCSVAELTMRRLSLEFIDRYLAALGDRALESVGVYQLEGLGAQLFAKVDGDYFTILGLPLLPLLGFLREHQVVPA